MEVIDITEVEPLEFRPIVTVNPKSYYLVPKVIGEGSGSGGASSAELEKLKNELKEVRKYATNTATKLNSLSETVGDLSDQVEAGNDNVANLSNRVTTVENQSGTFNTLIQAANTNATRALNAVSDLVPATAAEVNATCT